MLHTEPLSRPTTDRLLENPYFKEDQLQSEQRAWFYEQDYCQPDSCSPSNLLWNKKEMALLQHTVDSQSVNEKMQGGSMSRLIRSHLCTCLLSNSRSPTRYGCNLFRPEEQPLKEYPDHFQRKRLESSAEEDTDPQQTGQNKTLYKLHGDFYFGSNR